MTPSARGDAVPQLITLLSDSDAWVRMAAARALGELRDHRAGTQLIATLSDNNWRVRELVVWALSEMKDARAVTALLEDIFNFPFPEVCRECPGDDCLKTCSAGLQRVPSQHLISCDWRSSPSIAIRNSIERMSACLEALQADAARSSASVVLP